MEQINISIEQRLLEVLRERGLTFAAAESCTGGLIAKRITDLPGASAVFRGGVVSYTNAVKRDVLGVPQQLLDEHGAVSGEVAKAMAEGALRITGADLAVSVTGVAGPDKDDRGNEVGTVYFGVACDKFSVWSLTPFQFFESRNSIRSAAADMAFHQLLLCAEKHWPIVQIQNNNSIT